MISLWYFRGTRHVEAKGATFPGAIRSCGHCVHTILNLLLAKLSRSVKSLVINDKHTIINFGFDDVHLRLNLSWDSLTNQPDST